MKTSRPFPLAHQHTRRTFLGAALRSALAAGFARAAFAQGADRKLPANDGKLRIICFGAHPDDCEWAAAGVGALWAAAGHHVKFVSVTNGDIGHWREAGGPLALRRKKEVAQADAMLGVTTEVLDIHDGELEPTLENRRTITRLIREWRAHLVLAHRPNDYHPDHRYTGVLVQDAAYMVTVPFITPDVAPIPLKENPAFMYYADDFQKPNPFKPDIIIATDSIIEKKLAALAIMESQFLEGGANGHAGLIPKTPADRARREKEVREEFEKTDQGVANRFRAQLKEWYGEQKAAQVKYAEAFEICEYGRQPDKAELKKLFPFFG